MRRKMWMTIVVLLGAISGSLLVQRAGWTRSFGTPVADTLLTVARGTGNDIVFLSVPGPQEASLAGRVATSSLPAAEQESMRKALTSTRAWSMSSKGHIEAADAVPQIVEFEDPATGEALQIELLAVQSGSKTHYVVRPDEPPLIGNPAASEQSLVERNAAFFALDTNKMNVEFLGDPGERSSWITENNKDGVQSEFALNWGQEAHWSPDGRYIAFISNRDLVGEQLGNSVWVHEQATGTESVVVRGRAGQHLVVRGWTPRNEIIVDEYTTANGNLTLTSIVALNLDGSRRKLVSDPGRFVAQSPDGRTLIWLEQRRGRPNQLRALDLSTGRQSTIWQDSPEGPRLRSLKVEFSANGQRLVTDLENARNVQMLLVYNLKTGKSKVIPVQSGWQIALPASWAGNRLLLPLMSKGAARTYLVNPDEQ